MTPIRWTSSPWGFRKSPFERYCKWMSDHGIGHVCGQFSNEVADELFQPGNAKENAPKILKITERYNVEFASFNADGDFTVHDHVEKQIALCCEQIDQAAALNPEVIILFAGWENRDDPQVYDQIGASLRTVAQHAASYGLTVAMENHGGVTRTVEQCNRILAKINEPNVGLNYDPANFLMYGQNPLVLSQPSIDG